MTTAAQIIDDALQEIGVLGAGQTAYAEDATLCLRKLNQILQSWSTGRLYVPYLAQVTVTLSGLASYTIGPAGAVVAARPIRVESASARDASGYDYDVSVKTREEYDGIAIKGTTGGPPECVFYDKTLTNGTLYVYPKGSGYTLTLDCLSLLTSFASVSTTLTLPEGYERALYLTLADESAAAFGRTVSPDTRRRQAGAIKAIKRINAEPMLLDIDTGGELFQIERGY